MRTNTTSASLAPSFYSRLSAVLLCCHFPCLAPLDFHLCDCFDAAKLCLVREKCAVSVFTSSSVDGVDILYVYAQFIPGIKPRSTFVNGTGDSQQKLQLPTVREINSDSL